MRSRLYQCRTMHQRFKPKRHGFSYGLFLFAVDLDELATLDKAVRFFSWGRANLYSFRDDDFLPLDEATGNLDGSVNSAPREPRALKERVIEYLAAHDIDIQGGRVELITMPRMLGHLFNPVSFYFCRDASGTVVASIAEVTNTFREVKPFLLGSSTRHGNVFRLRMPKHFYVSPYSDVDVAFDFSIPVPGDRLGIRIDDYTGGERTFTSTLTGRSLPLTSANLVWQTLRHPLVSLRVIALIHWQAFRLFLKRVPWFRKAARREDQRGVFRPHASITREVPQKA